MGKEAQQQLATQPFSVSTAKVVVARLINGVMVRQRAATLKRFEMDDNLQNQHAGFDLSLCPVGVVARDTRKKGHTHVIPWGNIEDVEVEE